MNFKSTYFGNLIDKRMGISCDGNHLEKLTFIVFHIVDILRPLQPKVTTALLRRQGNWEDTEVQLCDCWALSWMQATEVLSNRDGY